MEGLAGKVVIVTGSSSGVGLATAQTLLKYNAKVFAVDINPSPAALGSSENLKFHQANLVDPGAPDEVAKLAVESFGKIDALLNIAGVMDNNNSVDSITDEMWDRTIAINLTVPVKLMRAVVPHMIKAGGGSIVNVASRAGLGGGVAGVAYTSSKHGLIGATKNVAWRYRGDKVRCNAICPGGVRTSIQKSVDQNKMDTVATAIMKPVMDLVIGENFEGIAEPQSHANVLAFLVSDLSSEINGAILPVDDGWAAP